jgi:magnesium transporter
MGAAYSILTYNKTELEYKECNDLNDILAQIKPDRVTWITLSGITLQDDRHIIKNLLDYFQLPPQLIDNIYNQELELFEDDHNNYLYLEHTFLVYNPAIPEHVQIQCSIILGANFLILLEKTSSGLFEKTRRRIVDKRTRAQGNEADYLLYLLLKTMIINYENIFKVLVEKLEILEDEVIGHPAQDYVYDKILNLREEIKPFHTYLIALDDFVDTLREEEFNFITRETKKLFTRTLNREVDDLLASYQHLRGWLTELLEIHRSNVNENTNRVMKILTVVSTIFLPLTFIAGVYGMNFEYIPSLGWKWGYLMVWLVMIGVAAGIIIYVRHKKWL